MTADATIHISSAVLPERRDRILNALAELPDI